MAAITFFLRELKCATALEWTHTHSQKYKYTESVV